MLLWCYVVYLSAIDKSLLKMFYSHQGAWQEISLIKLISITNMQQWNLVKTCSDCISIMQSKYSPHNTWNLQQTTLKNWDYAFCYPFIIQLIHTSIHLSIIHVSEQISLSGTPVNRGALTASQQQSIPVMTLSDRSKRIFQNKHLLKVKQIFQLQTQQRRKFFKKSINTM